MSSRITRLSTSQTDLQLIEDQKAVLLSDKAKSEFWYDRSVKIVNGKEKFTSVFRAVGYYLTYLIPYFSQASRVGKVLEETQSSFKGQLEKYSKALTDNSQRVTAVALKARNAMAALVVEAASVATASPSEDEDTDDASSTDKKQGMAIVVASKEILQERLENEGLGKRFIERQVRELMKEIGHQSVAKFIEEFKIEESRDIPQEIKKEAQKLTQAGFFSSVDQAESALKRGLAAKHADTPEAVRAKTIELEKVDEDAITAAVNERIKEEMAAFKTLVTARNELYNPDKEADREESVSKKRESGLTYSNGTLHTLEKELVAARLKLECARVAVDKEQGIYTPTEEEEKFLSSIHGRAHLSSTEDRKYKLIQKCEAECGQKTAQIKRLQNEARKAFNNPADKNAVRALENLEKHNEEVAKKQKEVATAVKELSKKQIEFNKQVKEWQKLDAKIAEKIELGFSISNISEDESEDLDNLDNLDSLRASIRDKMVRENDKKVSWFKSLRNFFSPTQEKEHGTEDFYNQQLLSIKDAVSLLKSITDGDWAAIQMEARAKTVKAAERERVLDERARAKAAADKEDEVSETDEKEEEVENNREFENRKFRALKQALENIDGFFGSACRLAKIHDNSDDFMLLLGSKRNRRALAIMDQVLMTKKSKAKAALQALVQQPESDLA